MARLRRVVDFAEGQGCLTRRLVGYFGEELPGDCGHCAQCAGEPAVPLAPAAATPSTPTIRAALTEIALLAAEHPGALGTPRQRARFACGLSSPRTARARITRHRAFGSLADAPFEAVLDGALAAGSGGE